MTAGFTGLCLVSAIQPKLVSLFIPLKRLVASCKSILEASFKLERNRLWINMAQKWLGLGICIVLCD